VMSHLYARKESVWACEALACFLLVLVLTSSIDLYAKVDTCERDLTARQRASQSAGSSAGLVRIYFSEQGRVADGFLSRDGQGHARLISDSNSQVLPANYIILSGNTMGIDTGHSDQALSHQLLRTRQGSVSNGEIFSA